MGVYIANAEMPKTCEDCGFDFIGCDLYKRTNAHEYRHPNCLLFETDENKEYFIGKGGWISEAECAERRNDE